MYDAALALLVSALEPDGILRIPVHQARDRAVLMLIHHGFLRLYCGMEVPPGQAWYQVQLGVHVTDPLRRHPVIITLSEESEEEEYSVVKSRWQIWSRIKNNAYQYLGQTNECSFNAACQKLASIASQFRANYDAASMTHNGNKLVALETPIDSDQPGSEARESLLNVLRVRITSVSDGPISPASS